MDAMSDSEILAALPVESRMKIDNAFEALSQSLLTDKERIILYRVAHSLKLNPTDTHFSVMAAMHYYLQLYQIIPDKIAKASGVALSDHIATLNAQAEFLVTESKGALIEMVRQTVSDTVSIEISKAAQRMTTERFLTERNKFFVMATAGMTICSLIFGGTGYLYKRSADIANINDAIASAKDANNRADVKIDHFKEVARNEIEAMKKNIGWSATREGRIAKLFFDSGAGLIAATCNSPTWEIQNTAKGKYCVPRRPDLFGGSEDQYGWKIP